jgi:hypothetical protein
VTRVVLAICALIGAGLGLIVGTDVTRREDAWKGVSAASDELDRSSQLRSEVDRLRVRFADVKSELDAAQTQAAATAARVKLFQLRVDMVAVEDEIAVLTRRRPDAHDF